MSQGQAGPLDHSNGDDFPAWRTAPAFAPSSPPSCSGAAPSTPPHSFSPESPSLPSANDPFAAMSKAQSSQHPSFSKQHPHAKHPGRQRGKRSLPNSPDIALDPTTSPSSSAFPSRPWGRQHQYPKVDGPVQQPRLFRGTESHGASGGGSSSGVESRRDRVLGGFFADSSEDAPTSDDHLEAVPWSHPGSDVDAEHPHNSAAMVGLGLGTSYKEQTSPSAGRRAPRSSSGFDRQSFSRSSSVNDPFGAFQSSANGSFSAKDLRAAAHRSPQQPRQQRRRLVGTSPKQPLQKAGGNYDDSDSDQDEGDGFRGLLDRREHRLADPPGSDVPAMAHLWHKLVEDVWDSGDTVIDLDGRQVTSIHPVVADLANYVAIDPPRSFEQTQSTASLPNRTSSFQRQPSVAFPRTASTALASSAAATGTGSPSKALKESETIRGAGKGKLQLYLAGNRLTRLPSALFEVGNLRVLSLRSNYLTHLPAAIGDLHNLRELNIAGNRLQYLPAEIQKLRLSQFFHFPNPFMRPPAEFKLELRSVHSVTGAVLAATSTDADVESASGIGEDCVGGDRNDGEDDDDPMETEFLADASTKVMATAKTPEPESSSAASIMGPPPLPMHRGGVQGTLDARKGPLAAAAAGTDLPRRTFDRTRSDVQVSALLSRGGGRMLGGAGGAGRSSQLTNQMSMPEEEENDRDEAMVEENPSRAGSQRNANSNEQRGGHQVARVLGPLRHSQVFMPSLRELCIRKLLSPCEDASSLIGDSKDADDSAATIKAVTASGSSPRRVVWTRIPSSSSAYQYRYHNGRRPSCLLENYENGTLRELETDAQMEAGTIKILEAARRSMEGKWGSTSGISGYSVAPSKKEDSWCRGVMGTAHESTTDGRWPSSATTEDGGDNEDHAVDADDDASSPEVDGPDGQPKKTKKTKQLSRSRQATSGTHTATSPSVSSPARAPVPVLDVSGQLDTQGDDSMMNPYYNRCPNPQHAQTQQLSAIAGVQPMQSSSSNNNIDSSSAHNRGQSGPAAMALNIDVDYPVMPAQTPFAPLYETAMEERIEWVSHIAGVKVLQGAMPVVGASGTSATTTVAQNSGVIPILWRGCRKGCLDFLEA